MKKFTSLLPLILAAVILTACDVRPKNSDTLQSEQQERMLGEATMKTGMPGIINFRERKLAKLILELRDQEGLVTYTYMENLQPAVVPGKTALGGKLTYMGETIGYPPSVCYAIHQSAENRDLVIAGWIRHPTASGSKRTLLAGFG